MAWVGRDGAIVTGRCRSSSRRASGCTRCPSGRSPPPCPCSALHCTARPVAPGSSSSPEMVMLLVSETDSTQIRSVTIYARALPVAIAPDEIGAVLGVDLAGLREVDLVDVARGREVRSLVRQVERVV